MDTHKKVRLSIALREALLGAIVKNSSYLKFIRTDGHLVLPELIVAGSNRIKWMLYAYTRNCIFR